MKSFRLHETFHLTSSFGAEAARLKIAILVRMALSRKWVSLQITESTFVERQKEKSAGKHKEGLTREKMRKMQ